jgi:two-component system NtrC family response regulator
VTVSAAQTLAGVIAESRAMKEIVALVLRLGDTRSPVLLEGESGTGKDLVAHWLHYGGSRREGPFIKVHCPSIPGELLESELFGHERGAFTDARQAKAGKLEIAAAGTLYFDQVQDLVPPLQAKLLRVIEERQFERVGGTRTLEVDARFVASANVDLAAAVRAGLFREDLYHRLNVVPLRLEPLRNRREDILPLALAFLARERERGATAASGLSPEAGELLRGYHWPGNVRELRSVIERVAGAVKAGEIGPQALPGAIVEQPSTLWAGRERRPTLRDVELAYIRFVLEATGGSQTRAAAVLGISRKALWEKRRRYGIG